MSPSIPPDQLDQAEQLVGEALEIIQRIRAGDLAPDYWPVGTVLRWREEYQSDGKPWTMFALRRSDDLWQILNERGTPMPAPLTHQDLLERWEHGPTIRSRRVGPVQTANWATATQPSPPAIKETV